MADEPDDFDPLDISAYEQREGHRGFSDVAHGEVVEGVAKTNLDTETTAQKVARLGGVVAWRKDRKQQAFLEAYARTGNVTMSCGIAGVGYGAFAHWKKDEVFMEAFNEALEISVDALEAQARHLALHGVDEPIIHMGQIVAYKTKYSEAMLTLLLKAKRRSEFGDKVEMAHDVKGGVLVVPGMASPDDWEAQAKAQQAEYRDSHGDDDE